MTDLTTFFKDECIHIDTAVERVLREAGDLAMYDMLKYFMGFENALQPPSEGKHGKRTRSALLLLIAHMYGESKSALTLAAAIELFHNFTLIHDDIVDHDELRRGQPTVWKLWGVDHAINSGDAQLLLVTDLLLEAARLDPVRGASAAQMFSRYFREVVEGQYLDFMLTAKKLSDSSVTEDVYLEMTRKKTAVLIGAATQAGGVSAGCSEADAVGLFTFGESLGMAYQIADDFVSVWGSVEKSGKQAQGDIIERKKTYPVLYARSQGTGGRLKELYEKQEPLTPEEVAEVVCILEQSGAKEATRAYVDRYVQEAGDAVQHLSLGEKEKQTLRDLVELLVTGAHVVEKKPHV